MSQTNWREPDTLAAGDTLAFTRRLSDYLASAGWYLTYELRGGAQAIEFSSMASGDNHAISVAGALTSLWLVTDYTLYGYAINGSDRHQIYVGDFTVTVNAQAAGPDAVVTTHYQRMVTLLEAVMEGKATHDLKVTKIEMSVVERLTFAEMADAYAKYKQLRNGEIDAERVANGQPSRNKIHPFFNITQPSCNGFGPGREYYFGR